MKGFVGLGLGFPSQNTPVDGGVRGIGRVVERSLRGTGGREVHGVVEGFVRSSRGCRGLFGIAVVAERLSIDQGVTRFRGFASLSLGRRRFLRLIGLPERQFTERSFLLE